MKLITKALSVTAPVAVAVVLAACGGGGGGGTPAADVSSAPLGAQAAGRGANAASGAVSASVQLVGAVNAGAAPPAVERLVRAQEAVAVSRMSPQEKQAYDRRVAARTAVAKRAMAARKAGSRVTTPLSCDNGEGTLEETVTAGEYVYTETYDNCESVDVIDELTGEAYKDYKNGTLTSLTSWDATSWTLEWTDGDGDDVLESGDYSHRRYYRAPNSGTWVLQYEDSSSGTGTFSTSFTETATTFTGTFTDSSNSVWELTNYTAGVEDFALTWHTTGWSSSGTYSGNTVANTMSFGSTENGSQAVSLTADGYGTFNAQYTATNFEVGVDFTGALPGQGAFSYDVTIDGGMAFTLNPDFEGCNDGSLTFVTTVPLHYDGAKFIYTSGTMTVNGVTVIWSEGVSGQQVVTVAGEPVDLQDYQDACLIEGLFNGPAE